jgi:hypothetical protein
MYHPSVDSLSRLAASSKLSGAYSMQGGYGGVRKTIAVLILARLESCVPSIEPRSLAIRLRQLQRDQISTALV